jgi:hypothetical protein
LAFIGWNSFRPRCVTYANSDPNAVVAGRWRGREKKLKLAERALADFDRWTALHGLAAHPDGASATLHESIPV